MDSWDATAASGEVINFSNWNSMVDAIKHKSSESANWDVMDASVTVSGNLTVGSHSLAGGTDRDITIKVNDGDDALIKLLETTTEGGIISFDGNANELQLSTFDDGITYDRLNIDRDNANVTFKYGWDGQAAGQQLQLDYGSNTTYIYGPGSTKTLHIAPTSGDNPYIAMIGGGAIQLVSDTNIELLPDTAGYVQIREGASQSFKLFYTAAETKSTLEGPGTANDELVLKANSSDGYPNIHMIGQSDIRLHSAADITFYEEGTQMFEFRYHNNSGRIYGPATSGEDLHIYSNSADSKPSILMYGLSGITFNATLGYKEPFMFTHDGAQLLIISGTATQTVVAGQGSSGDDFKILTNTNQTTPYIYLNGGAELDLVAGTDIRFWKDQDQAFKFILSAGNSVIYGGDANTDNLAIYANSDAGNAYPVIHLEGDDYIILDSFNDIYFKEQGTQTFKFSLVSNEPTIYGKSGRGNLVLRANEPHVYPRIFMSGSSVGANKYIELEVGAGSHVDITHNGTQTFKFSGTSAKSHLLGGNTSGDDLWIWANTVDDYPHVQMAGDSAFILNIGGNCNDLLIKDAGAQIFKFLHSDDDSIIYGSDTSKDDVKIYPNSKDSLPRFHLFGSGQIDLDIKTYLDIRDDENQIFKFSGTTGYSRFYGGDAATDDLIIWANSSGDGEYPRIRFEGQNHLYLDTKSAKSIYFTEEGTQTFIFDFDGTRMSNIYGGATRDDGVTIYPNNTGNEGYIRINAMDPQIANAGHIVLYTKDSIECYISGTHPFFIENSDGGGHIFRVYSGSGFNTNMRGGAKTGESWRMKVNTIDDWPTIDMHADAALELIASSQVDICDSDRVVARFWEADNINYIGGGGGRNTYIRAHLADSRPVINLLDAGRISFDLPDGEHFRIYNNGNAAFQFYESADNSYIKGGDAGDDDLYIYANHADTRAALLLFGQGQVEVCSDAGANARIVFKEESYEYARFASGTAVILYPGTKEPGKTAGTIWMSGNTTNARLYMMSSNSGTWKRFSFDA